MEGARIIFVVEECREHEILADLAGLHKGCHTNVGVNPGMPIELPKRQYIYWSYPRQAHSLSSPTTRTLIALWFGIAFYPCALHRAFQRLDSRNVSLLNPFEAPSTSRGGRSLCCSTASLSSLASPAPSPAHPRQIILHFSHSNDGCEAVQPDICRCVSKDEPEQLPAERPGGS